MKTDTKKNENNDMKTSAFSHQKIWSHDEIEHLKTLYDEGLTYKEIGERIGRTENAVCGRIMELGIGSRSHQWTSEELNQLNVLHNKGFTFEEIARHFGKTKKSIYCTLRRHGIITCERKRRTWSEDEIIEFIKLYNEGWELKKISGKIGRSVASIVHKLKSLGISNRSVKWTNDEVNILKKLYLNGLTYSVIARTLGKTKFAVSGKIISLKLNKKFQYKGERSRWSEKEIKLLKELYTTNTPVKEIAEIVNRSEQAVILKAKSLDIAPKIYDRREWTNTETEQLKKLLENGLTYHEIAQKLNRTNASISHKIHRTGITKKNIFKKHEKKIKKVEETSNIEQTITLKKRGMYKIEGWDNRKIKLLKYYYISKLPIYEIAQKLNRPIKTVRKIIIRLGLDKKFSM